jgi:hypothetical protein
VLGLAITCERAQRLGACEVAFLGDLERVLAAAHDHHGQAESLAQRRVVGRGDAVPARHRMRVLDHGAREALGRLHPPEPLACDRAHDRPGLVDLLERVDDRQRRHRAVAAPRLRDHALDHVVGHQRPRGVVDQHRLDVLGHVLEPVGHALGALPTAGRHQQPVDVALE